MKEEKLKDFHEEDVKNFHRTGAVVWRGVTCKITKSETLDKTYRRFTLSPAKNPFDTKTITVRVGDTAPYMSPEEIDYNARVKMWQRLRQIKRDYVCGIIRTPAEKYKRMKHELEIVYEKIDDHRHANQIQSFDFMRGRR
jgi:hypothetical protein